MPAWQYVYVMKDLTKSYQGGREVFKGITLSFLPDVKIGVLGPNGAGKSTLMKIMAGLDKEFGGEAWAAEGARVGYLPQEPHLNADKTVGENVMEAFTALSAQQGMGRGDIEDGVMGVMRFESGLLAQFHDAYTIKHAITGLQVHGTEGSIYAKNVMTQQPIGNLYLLRNGVREPIDPGPAEDLYAHAVRRFNDQCLARPGDVRTGENNYYTVFTPFRRALYKHLTDRGLGEALAPLAPPKKQDSAGIAPSPIPASVDGFTSTVPTDLWLAGEAVARKRLRDFIANHATDYKSSRNFPAVPGTSVLSPYLAVGAISARQCMAAALEANHHQLDSGDPGLATWMSEIAWREFYRHVIVGFPRVSMGRAFKPATERIRWNDDTAAFDAWCAGRTGIPIVDAGMRQLLATGWMHNRVRMIVAMYLTKDLFIHWCRGEQHFMRHLIDGDLASNNGGWQWSASTGTDAAPYFRIFNPVTQSRKFDPDGAYIKRWVPQLADVEGGEDGPIHDLSGIPALQLARIDYRAPLVDRAAVKDRVLKAFGAIAPSR